MGWEEFETTLSFVKRRAAAVMMAGIVTDQSGLVFGSLSRSMDATLKMMVARPPTPKSEERHEPDSFIVCAWVTSFLA